MKERTVFHNPNLSFLFFISPRYFKFCTLCTCSEPLNVSLHLLNVSTFKVRTVPNFDRWYKEANTVVYSIILYFQTIYGPVDAYRNPDFLLNANEDENIPKDF
jgi:hypothetical protein